MRRFLARRPAPPVSNSARPKLSSAARRAREAPPAVEQRPDDADGIGPATAALRAAPSAAAAAPPP